MSNFKHLVAIIMYVLLSVDGNNHHQFKHLKHVFDSKHHGVSDKRIIGGELTSISKYPYQVALEREIIPNVYYKFTCGGSIITEQHILTAGHCISENLRVKLGTSSIIDPFATVIKVEKYFKHPNYTAVNNVAYNDIAVLKLKSKIEFKENIIEKINLPAANSEPNISTEATLTGWGLIFSLIRIPSFWLVKADIPIISNEECMEDWAKLGLNTTIYDTNLCTLNYNRTKATCSGDSGGPLAQNHTVIGVVSFGLSLCELPRAPSVYTKVSKYVDWIQEQLQK